MTTGDETLKITFLEPEKILDADTGLRYLTYDYYEVNLGVQLQDSLDTPSVQAIDKVVGPAVSNSLSATFASTAMITILTGSSMEMLFTLINCL